MLDKLKLGFGRKLPLLLQTKRRNAASTASVSPPIW